MESSREYTPSDVRNLLRRVFLDTLNEISIPRVFSKKVEYSRGVLRVEQDLYDLSAYSRVQVIAFGKAANAMLDSLVALTGPRFEGIVVCGEPPKTQQPGFRYFVGSHPLPTEESMRAAHAILKSVSGMNESTLIIYLISGGASALVEVPHDEDISLEDLIATYRTLIHSGATIGEINAIRKHLSAIKGGRLAQAAFPARQVSIMVSDVPENSLDALASGPTMPDSTTEMDCYRIAAAHGMRSHFPESVRRIFEDQALEETPKDDDPAFVNSRWWPILSSSSAANAASEFLAQQGFTVEIDNTPDDWPYERGARYLLDRLCKIHKGGRAAALVSSRKITVKVGESPGAGGRNQQFALFCAPQIADHRIAILSAGTDGIDGNSPAAGAIADGTTVERARTLGLDPQHAMLHFDSFPFFETLGDTIMTGSTGNNIRDLRILLAY